MSDADKVVALQAELDLMALCLFQVRRLLRKWQADPEIAAEISEALAEALRG